MISRRPRIIGLTGNKGSGKDTVADYLVEKYHFHKIAYAVPIKEALSVMFRVDIDVFNDPEKKDMCIPELLGHTPRYLMKTLGTEWGRDTVDKGIWVSLLWGRLEKLHKEGKDVVITDVRFDNEAESVIGFGGKIWEISRLREGIEEDGHPSERGISENLVYDSIFNTSTLRALYAQVGVSLARYDRWNTRPDESKAL